MASRRFPDQGLWTEDDYLALDTNHFVELVEGYLEVLPMPTTSHQQVVANLIQVIAPFVNGRNVGTALFGPLPVRLRPGTFREPDIVLMLAENADRIGEDYWDGADLVMEVVSDDRESHDRDLVKKRMDYAAAGIPEYWVIDPQAKRITVLSLEGQQYDVHAECESHGRGTSALLTGFNVAASEVFALLP
jgi:Uma2 family endonuclease